VDWQGWDLRLGFNGREGLVLYDVGFVTVLLLLYVLLYACFCCFVMFFAPCKASMLSPAVLFCCFALLPAV
jgi:hypothetical protein